MYIESRKEITKEQFLYLQHCDYKDFYDYINNEAVHSPYHPAGYGFESPKILNKDGKYFVTWTHWDSCD